jgi:hypothetical protein
MKTIRLIGLAIISTILLMGCNSYLDVYSDYDRSANFADYRTYSWKVDKDQTNTIYNNPVIRNNLRNYVNTALTSRNFRQTASNPDVYMDLNVVNNKRTASPPPTAYYPTVGYNYYYNYYYPVYYPYYPYYPSYPNVYYSPSYPSYSYNYPYYPYNYSYGTAYYYDEDPEGAITLAMIDSKTDKMIWTATASGYIYDPDYDDNLSTAVDQLMETYPGGMINPSGQ